MVRKARLVEIVFLIIGLIVLAGFIIAGLGRVRESRRRVRCLCNLKHHGLALGQYSQDSGGCYPWRVGAVDANEAWRDLAMLFPSYNSAWETFFCPSSKDRLFDPKCASGDKQHYSLEPLLPADSREVISYGYCFDARDPKHPKPWTEEARATVCLMADKKAGVPLSRRSNHRLTGRDVVYHDWHVRWEPGVRALDPDVTDNEIGAPEAADYHAWWSDPPFYGE